MKAIVLSIPHSGTHFACKLLTLLGVEVEYTHFQLSWEKVISDRLDSMEPGERIVVPFRHEPDIKRSWQNRIGKKGADYWGGRMDEYHECWEVRDKLMPKLNAQGFFMLPIVRSAHRWRTIDALAAYLSIDISAMSEALYEFIDEWPRVKSWNPETKDWRDENPREMSGFMTTHMLKEKDDGA